MIIGFSRHSTGSGARAGNYLTNEINPVTKELREVAPEVVKGDMESTVQLIDSLSFKHKYSSGVLSFAPGVEVTAEMEQDIISGFERAAFAGLEADQYSIAWVRHEHASHHELHFLTARVELSSGKSMNVRPPGDKTKQLYDDVRSLVNDEYGLADPDDPERTRSLALPNYLEKMRAQEKRLGKELQEDLRRGIHGVIMDQVTQGVITSRDGVITALKGAGFEVPRAGKNYITVSDGTNKIRMKGIIYERQFESTRSIEGQLREADIGTERSAGRDISKVSERLERAIQSRARYNNERYQRPNELALGRDRGERERDLQRDTENIERDPKVDLVAGLQNVGDSSGSLSDCLWELRGPLEVHEQRSLAAGRGDLGETREPRLSQSSREERVSSLDRERPKEILEGAFYEGGGGKIHRDAQGVRTDGLVHREGNSLREIERLDGGGLYDRARETVDRSLKALRDAAQKARRVFEQAIERFAQAIQHGNEFVCRIEQALRGNERDHQRVAKQLERSVKRQKQQEMWIER